MSINSNPRSQFELFPGNSDSVTSEAQKVRMQIKDLTLSIENIIVVCIILVMTFVLFFSFGVERGKRLNSAEGVVTDETIGEGANTETVEIKLDTDGFVLEATQAEEIKKEEIISVPVEKQLTDEHLFTIQVASFKRESNAQIEADRLIDVGYESFVVAKGKYSIVCVGKFALKAEANQTSRKLRTKYRDLLVRRL